MLRPRHGQTAPLNPRFLTLNFDLRPSREVPATADGANTKVGEERKDEEGGGENGTEERRGVDEGGTKH